MTAVPWYLRDDDPQPANALVVQTAGPVLLKKAVSQLMTAYTEARFTVLLQKGMGDRVSLPGDVETLVNPGPKPAFIRDLRERQFDNVYVLYTNEAGYWKLKLLPFLVAHAGVFVINENLDWFPVTLKRPEALAGHMRWRMESSVTWAGPEPARLHRLAHLLGYPFVLTYLAGYEKLRSRAVSRAEGRDWKSDPLPENGKST